jgi:polyisoprenoid-binding protein YceI
MNTTHRWLPRIFSHSLSALALAALLIAATSPGAAQSVDLQLDAAKTSVTMNLSAALHSVHGTFRLKKGALQFDPASGKISGEVVVDARSGDTGNGMRDRKMHKEILESERFPDIVFHPDRVEGTVAAQGKSSVKVHGMFNVHGVNHEITVPAEVDMASDRWTANLHFTIPYEKWGMKNPSNLFLHVSDAVEIEIAAAGSATRAAASNTAK